MTCKDCVHFEVCLPNSEAYGFKMKTCSKFKPKSRFVELPCEVGQTVYNLMGGFVEKQKVNRVVLILKQNEKHPLDYIKELDEIGKTVFLSREDAEKALKEREKE
jgi:hypothetical protein